MRIKELREQKCLSQLDVAKGINTSQRNIGRWETGANEPSSSFVLKLADFFDVSTDYLLGREDDLGNVATSGVALSSQQGNVSKVTARSTTCTNYGIRLQRVAGKVE